ncbi:nucleoside/nucleotide kinase family protein [Planotetraspora sp. A-T 1434]|uniref:nucleoside/nucleotide kinase family protein n=1 Tax=Planotetraspora sp. A-T 1434 TaxID=2979219 RepID=UPI0021BE4B42|nr:nucleoside/nucleotide kinase family protein [Planotetraspora sp. A-T 1434]MCT9929138.1 nucleoside/nucleotide kinase family protein [Planotetraspora sp. A-T 1434]
MKSLDQLLDRAENLLAIDGRHLLGITGPPGAGKSTLAGWLESTLAERHGAEPPLVAQVPMDGFHLSNAELAARGLSNRKGAPETFDVAGYRELLRRTREDADRDWFAPSYSRELHEPVPDSNRIPSSVRLIISEGNYLLVGDGGWAEVGPLFDEVWFVVVETEIARERLTTRQITGGRSPESAEEWVGRNDMANLAIVNGTAPRADVLVKLDIGAYNDL